MDNSSEIQSLFSQFSPRQSSVLVGIILGDAWIELNTSGNARLGFQFTIKNNLLFDVIYLDFKQWITENPATVDKQVREGKYTTASSEPKFQKRVRTRYNNMFIPIHRLFYYLEGDKWIKLFPSVPVLSKLLTPLAFAYLLLCDGSRKSKSTSGYEIHLQGVGFESVARVCLVLHEKWGIKAWPAFDNHAKKQVSYWVVYIASVSIDKWRHMVEEEALKVGMYHQKMPLPRKSTPRETPRTRQAHATFLSFFADDEQLRNDISYKIPQDKLKAYWDQVNKKDT